MTQHIEPVREEGILGVTQRHIAEAVGIDRAAVSRALSGRGEQFGLSRDRIVEIRKTARRLGYRPNAAARATASGRCGCAGLLLSADCLGRSSLPGTMLRGITEALEQRGMHLTVAVLPDARLTDEWFVPKLLREWTADGLLINYNKSAPHRMIDLIERHHIPSIWINDKRRHDCCRPDDLAAGREAAERLIRLGHRRIAYVSFSYQGDDSHYSEIDRRDGCTSALRAAGLSERFLLSRVPPEAPELRTQAVLELLRAPDRPTALVVYGSSSMFHVVRASERLGLGVPRDLSLMVFAGELAYAGQEVAAMRVPEAAVGSGAVEMLLAKLASPGERLAPRAVPFGFSAGETLAAPPGL